MRTRSLAPTLALLLAAAPSLLPAQSQEDVLWPRTSLPGGVARYEDFQVEVGALSYDLAAINDAGEFQAAVGPGDPGTAVPEPATVVLTGVGLLSLGLAARRRRRA